MVFGGLYLSLKTLHRLWIQPWRCLRGLLLLSRSRELDKTIVSPAVDDDRLLSLHNLEREDTTKLPQAAEGATIAGGVGFPGTAAQSQELSSG